MDHGDQTVDLESLATRASQGDEHALHRLLEEIQPRVRRICGRMLLYPEDAEEAAQDALLLVSTRIHTFAGRSKFTTWLHVALVCCMMRPWFGSTRPNPPNGCRATSAPVMPRFR